MKYFIPFSLAKDCAIAFETFLSYSRSDLLPTRNSITSGQHCSLTSRIHVFRLSKVDRSVIEYPKITASADRQKIFVIDLKDSQPAVSQICNFRTVSSTLMRQEPKSTPTVTLCSVSNESFVSLVSTHDLPIPKKLWVSYFRNLLTCISQDYNFQQSLMQSLLIKIFWQPLASKILNLSVLISLHGFAVLFVALTHVALAALETFVGIRLGLLVRVP